MFFICVCVYIYIIGVLLNKIYIIVPRPLEGPVRIFMVTARGIYNDDSTTVGCGGTRSDGYDIETQLASRRSIWIQQCKSVFLFCFVYHHVSRPKETSLYHILHISYFFPSPKRKKKVAA